MTLTKAWKRLRRETNCINTMKLSLVHQQIGFPQIYQLLSLQLFLQLKTVYDLSATFMNYLAEIRY